MATKYHELIVECDAETLKGFIEGFMTTKGIKSGVIIAREHDIQTHQLREILTFHGNYCHVIVSGRHRRSLVAAIERTPDIACEIVSDEEIANAFFTFKFETFSRKVAAELKRTFKKLPAGLTLVGYEPKETIDPSGEGIEFYSPMHDYSFSGKGSVQGDITKLIRFHERLKDHVFIETKRIVLEH
jgi:hypothetical protein